jgi:hypothetical protein
MKNWLLRKFGKFLKLDVDDLCLKPRNEEFSIYVTHLLKGFKNPYDIRRISYIGGSSVYFESYSPSRDAFPFDTKNESFCMDCIVIEGQSISVWLKSGAERFNAESLVIEIKALIEKGTHELMRENTTTAKTAESWKNMKEFVAKVQRDK